MFCQPTLSNQFWERKSDAGCRLFCDDYQTHRVDVLRFAARKTTKYNSYFSFPSFLDSHERWRGLSNLHLACLRGCLVSGSHTFKKFPPTLFFGSTLIIFDIFSRWCCWLILRCRTWSLSLFCLFLCDRYKKLWNKVMQRCLLPFTRNRFCKTIRGTIVQSRFVHLWLLCVSLFVTHYLLFVLSSFSPSSLLMRGKQEHSFISFARESGGFPAACEWVATSFFLRKSPWKERGR